MSKENILTVCDIQYSWKPQIGFNEYKIEIFTGSRALSTGLHSVYVNGDKSSLETILAKWNESPNFKYEVKD